jgi:hypothetical protein
VRHHRAPSDQARAVATVTELAPELAHLVLELAMLERAAHGKRECLERERLGDVVGGAQLHRLHRRVESAEGGDDDDRELGPQVLDLG